MMGRGADGSPHQLVGISSVQGSKVQSQNLGVDIYSQVLKAVASKNESCDNLEHPGAGAIPLPLSLEVTTSLDSKRKYRAKKTQTKTWEGRRVSKKRNYVDDASASGDATPGQLWTQMEEFFRSVTPLDIELLLPLTCPFLTRDGTVSDSCLLIPTLGRHYTEKWSEEQAQQEAEIEEQRSVIRVKRKLLAASRVSKKTKKIGELVTTVISPPPENEDKEELCHVCNGGDSDESNQILFCDVCNVAVHQECYGVRRVPKGQWLCSWCSQKASMTRESNMRECLLCPVKRGALKPVVEVDSRGSILKKGLKFAHLFCSQWTPETYIGNMEAMEPIRGIEGVREERWRLLCSICKEKHGACIQCSHGMCATALHPLCAREAKLLMEVSSTKDSEHIEYRAYCTKHSSTRMGKVYLPANEGSDSGIGPLKSIGDEEVVNNSIESGAPGGITFSEGKTRVRKTSKKRNKLVKTVISPPPENEDEEELCHVCNGGDSDESNQILFCDVCNVAVHQECYGVQRVPKGQWLCSWCNRKALMKTGSNLRECLLCPIKGGALKPVVKVDGKGNIHKKGLKFAHLFCSQWIPETYIGNMEAMEPIRGIEGIREERWRLLCSICKEKHGACIQCSHGVCATAIHPLCARKAKLLMEVSSTEDSEDIEYWAYCSKHSSTRMGKVYLPAHERSDSTPPLKSTSDQEVVNKSREVGTPGSTSLSEGKTCVLVRASEEQALPSSEAISQQNFDEIKVLEGQCLFATSHNDVEGIRLPVHLVVEENGGSGTEAINCLKEGVPNKTCWNDIASSGAEVMESLLQDEKAVVDPYIGVNTSKMSRVSIPLNMEDRGKVDLKAEKTTCSSAEKVPRKSPRQSAVRADLGKLSIASGYNVGSRLRVDVQTATVEREQEAVTSIKPSVTEKVDSPLLLGKTEEAEEHNLKQGLEWITHGYKPIEADTNCGSDANKIEGRVVPVSQSSTMSNLEKFSQTQATSVVSQRGNLSSELMNEFLQPYAHPLIMQRLRDCQESGGVSLGRLTQSGDHNESDTPCISQPPSPTVVEVTNKRDIGLIEKKWEQLQEVEKQGVLKLAPDDEIEGEILVLQDMLLSCAQGNRVHCELLMEKLISEVAEEEALSHRRAQELVVVQHYLSQSREPKKQGRKERRDKETQAVLAAASYQVGYVKQDYFSVSDTKNYPLTPISGTGFGHSPGLIPTSICYSKPPVPKPTKLLSTPANLPPLSARSGAQARTPTLSKLAKPRTGAEQSQWQEEESVCDVCSNGVSSRVNKILICDSCKVAVHQGCYGAGHVPLGAWLCQPCVELQQQNPNVASPGLDAQARKIWVQCALCYGQGGAFKRSTDGHWWMPETLVGKDQSAPSEGMNNVMLDRYALRLQHLSTKKRVYD